MSRENKSTKKAKMYHLPPKLFFVSLLLIFLVQQIMFLALLVMSLAQFSLLKMARLENYTSNTTKSAQNVVSCTKKMQTNETNNNFIGK